MFCMGRCPALFGQKLKDFVELDTNRVTISIVCETTITFVDFASAHVSTSSVIIQYTTLLRRRGILPITGNMARRSST